MCAKPSFLHSLDVPIEMFANSFTVLKQQTLGRTRTKHVHCFQTQLTRCCTIIWFLVDKRPICCFFLYKKQSEYPD